MATEQVRVHFWFVPELTDDAVLDPPGSPSTLSDPQSPLVSRVFVVSTVKAQADGSRGDRPKPWVASWRRPSGAPRHKRRAWKLRLCGIRAHNFAFYSRYMVIAKLERTDRYEANGGHGAVTMHPELARVLAGEPPSPGVRGEIIESWRQSAALGLTPDHFDLPFDGYGGSDSRLLRAATPVVDRLGGDLTSTEISVVLADERCRVVARRAAGPLEETQLDGLMLSPGYLWGLEHAGTNGLSAAIASEVSMLIHGDEHFADILTTMVTAGAPIHDPRTARVLGVLAFACSTEAANQLLLPMVSRAAREVEQALLDDASGLDRLVQVRFLDARRRTRSPLAAVSRITLLTNAAAARRLRAADRPQLWDFVSCNLSGAGTLKTRFTLDDGSAVNVSLEAILDGREVAGALVRFVASTSEAPLSRPAHSSKPLRPTFGWDSLTEAEHSVSELVAEGFTNRDVAATLFLSPYTVDSHLRHIFRKLDINSRVDLVRMVTTRSIFQGSLVGAVDVA
jgi:DNA-binding CsgD family transcriptional regulator